MPGKSKGKLHDRLYLTRKELIEDGWGGKSDRSSAQFTRPLPYDCCSLSLQPFEVPICTADGTIYDLTNIVAWIKKYKVDPRTGAKISVKDLTTLQFWKNNDGKYHCPISYKEFTENSHIVAIKKTGNVYSYSTVQELIIQKKKWEDLVTHEPITKEDLITLQDPSDLERRYASTFYHVQKGLTYKEEEEVVNEDTKGIRADPSTERTLRMFKEQDKSDAPVTNSGAFDEVQARKTDSASFTSSYAAPVQQVVAKTTKKGYVTLSTNMGDMELEIHTDLIPLASENFLTHCEKGYYKGTKFHRLIPTFMVQGGDPTASGRGGESIWGKKFKDEFHPTLKHLTRGTLSMANSGKNTNGSQFFITFGNTQHLDNVHTIFGRVIEGLEVLDLIEKVQTEGSDRPVRDITITDTFVLFNPLTDDEMKLEANEKLETKRKKESKPEFGAWFSNPSGLEKPEQIGKIGQFIQSVPKPSKNGESKKRALDFGQVSQQNKKRKTGFGDFSNF